MESLQYSSPEMAVNPVPPSRSNYDLSNDYRATALSGAHDRLPNSSVTDLATSWPSGGQTAGHFLTLPEMISNSPLPPLPSRYGQHNFDTTGQVAPRGVKPRVTATLWEDEGSLCFQVEANGVCVARREDNHMINGTKLLNVAGMTRGRRDGILKSEKTRHVVKIGPMHLKGVWIPFDRALDFANKEKITELLYPLFVHNVGALLYHPTNQARQSIANAATFAPELKAPERASSSDLQPEHDTFDGSSSKWEPLTPPPSFGVAKATQTSMYERFGHQAFTRPEAGRPNEGSDTKIQNTCSSNADTGLVREAPNGKDRWFPKEYVGPLNTGAIASQLPDGLFAADSGYLSDEMETKSPAILTEPDTGVFDSMKPSSSIDSQYPPFRRSQRIEELQSLIHDLQRRTENLLKQTRVGMEFSEALWARQPSIERPQRSSSTPPPFSRARHGATANCRLRSQADCDPERPKAVSSPSFGPTYSPRSDADVSYNRSRRQCKGHNDGRSQSEPPGRRNRASSYQTQATKASGIDSTSNVPSGRGKSLQKRNATQSFRQHTHDTGQEDRLRGIKRRKPTNPKDKIGEKDRFPCIFYAGEPTQYPGHTKTYEYISQLLRHLRRHDFYACSKCFTKFEAAEDQEVHTQDTPCIKSCRNRRCLRYVPAGLPRDAAQCHCILSPHDQWRHLFSMQYPDKAVPDLASFQGPDMTELLIAEDELFDMGDLHDDAVPSSELGPASLMGNHIASLDETVHNSFEPRSAATNENSAHASLEHLSPEEMDFSFPEPFPMQLEQSDSEETSQPTGNGAMTVQIDDTFFNEVQRLRERVQLLEQRLSQPSDREQDLEMVLGNVWQALTRTGSSESQPESPVWRLVRRFAGGVLSSTSRPSQEVPPPPAPPAQSTSASWDPWHNQLFASQGIGSSNTWALTDSGYGSTESNASNKL